ncbi:MAG: DUF1707 SHOCT-like domain-containing protein [Trebonia sp.]
MTGDDVAGSLDMRASNRERDDTVTGLQVAFADGRLDDADFDTRVRAALAAVTRGDLARLTEDLPATDVTRGAAQSAAGSPAGLPRPGRLSLAYKTRLRRGGRWRVPRRFTAISYKGGTVLDLRAAELAGPLTTIRAVAYKTTVEVIAPPSLRVEVSGIGVSSADDHATAPSTAANAPVVHVRGLAYKGRVEIRSAP